MFKELLPQNEVLGTILDTTFVTLGGLGGIAGLITYRWKTKYQAKIQAEMQAKADESSQTLSEKISRRSKAFDLRIKKEYEFYEKFGKYSGITLSSMRNVKNTLIIADEKRISNIDAYRIIKDFEKHRDEIGEFITEYIQYCDSGIVDNMQEFLNAIANYLTESMKVFQQINSGTHIEIFEELQKHAEKLTSHTSTIKTLIRFNMDRAMNINPDENSYE